MQSTIAGMRMSVWQWQGHSPGLQELFGILAGSFLGLAELQTPEGFQLLTLSTRTYCVFFSLLPLHTAGMHGNGATEGLRRQPASQQYERLGHLPEKQFSDEHIHFLLSGRLSGKSCNKTVQFYKTEPPAVINFTQDKTLPLLNSQEAFIFIVVMMVSNGLQGSHQGVCQRLDPGHNPGDCIRQPPRTFNPYKHILISSME